MKPVNNEIIDFWKGFARSMQPVCAFKLLPQHLQERWVQIVHSNLQSYCPHLEAIILFNDQLPTAELIITAVGDRDYFQHVFDLVDGAPDFPDWKITPLQKRKSFDDLLPAGFYNIDVHSIYFIIDMAGPDFFGIRILIPGYDESQRVEFRQFAGELLMNLLGELFFGLLIRFFEVANVPGGKHSTELLPFLELPDVLQTIIQCFADNRPGIEGR